MKDYLAFWGGRVEAEATTNQAEAFINLCHRNRIPLRRLCRTDANRLRFTLPKSYFKKLRDPAFRTGTRVHILKKRGFFIWSRPYKKRWGLVFGVVLFFFLVYYSSCFIWKIQVTGCETVSAVQIAEDLKKMGLTLGCSRKINVNQLENRYLTGNDKIKWMSINIQGTTAKVEVAEQGIPPKMVDSSVPTNVYATRDGRILAINAYGGTPCVVAGQQVLAGDLLVTGDWLDSYGVRRLSHCLANVRAETCRNMQITVPLKQVLQQKNGKNRKFFAISLGNLRIPLYFKKKIDYNEYNTVSWVRTLSIGDFALPLALYCQKAEETEAKTLVRTPDEAKAVAYARLGFYEKDELAGLKILSRNVEESVGADAFVLKAVYQCEEEIGLSLPIQGATDAESIKEFG